MPGSGQRRPSKRLNFAHFIEIGSSKCNTIILTYSPGNRSKIFWAFVCSLKKPTLKLDLGTQKWPKSVFLEELKNFSFKPTRELIFFPITYFWFYWQITAFTREKPIRWEKWPQLDLNSINLLWDFGYFKKSHFSTTINENKYWKVIIARRKLKNAGNMGPISDSRRLW